jgi:glycosyltransferase involved in cell wall biosynthesis
MEICFVGSLPKPYGGVASHSYHLSKELARIGVDVNFIDTRLSDEKTVPQGVHHLMIADLGLLSTIKQLLKLPRLIEFWPEIRKYSECLRFRDLIKVFYIILKMLDNDRTPMVKLFHAQHVNERALATWLVARKFKKPLVITGHCAEFTDEDYWSRCSRLVEHMTSRADRVILVSRFTQRCMVSRGCEGQVSIVPNGVDTRFFRPGLDVSELRNQYGLGSDTKIILFVGDLHRRKGPDVLIRAAPLVAEKDMRVIIIGSKGGEEGRLRTLSDELSTSDRVIIIEEVKHELLPRFYNLADIFVFPTVMKTEGFGIVALEAMSCGTPVVASNIGAIPEVVREGKTGFLFPPGNVQELAEKINRILGDAELRTALGRAGRELAESEYTWDRVARKTAEIYNSAVASHPD